MPTSEAWKEYASCKGHADVFLSTSTTASKSATNKFDRMVTERSKAICNTCVVRPSCLDWALAERIPYFVFGGLSWPERRKLLPPKSRILVDPADDAMLG